MINIIKHVLVHGVTVLTVVIGGNAHADEWMTCVPYRVAAKSSGVMHIGCTNVPGWYYITPTSKNKDYIDRALYLGTSAITAGKSLGLWVKKAGTDGEITYIELFK